MERKPKKVQTAFRFDDRQIPYSENGRETKVPKK